MPINPFQTQPAGNFPQQDPTAYNAFGLQPGPWASPTQPGVQPNPVASPQAPQPASKAFQYLMPAMAGAGAGSQVRPTTSAPSAAMQTIGSGLGGAATGAMVGGVPGAAVGGLLGLVAGGTQAYFGLREARAQRRKEEREIERINKINEEERQYTRELNTQARSDSLEQERFRRRQNALASQWTAMQTVVNLLNQNMAHDDNLKTLFLERGR